MNAPEKRQCKNPEHPFQQKWYKYTPGYDDEDFCATCDSHRRFLKSVLEVILLPKPTLYGGKEIYSDRAEFHKLVDEAFDKQEGKS